MGEGARAHSIEKPDGPKIETDSPAEFARVTEPMNQDFYRLIT